MEDHFDAIVVGSGAGGSAAAYGLVKAGRRVLLLEKGGFLPRDGSTLDVRTVFKEGRFKNHEPWVDGDRKEFVPGEYYNIGGKTKWYGAALLRFSPHEFEAEAAHQALAWPISYEEMEPYYERAERLLTVNRFNNEPELQALLDRITSADPAWQVSALPLGLDKAILTAEEEAKHFDGFASVCGFKADAEKCFIEPIKDEPGLSVATGKQVIGLLHAAGDPAVITGVKCQDATSYHGNNVILAAGAMTSPRILQDHLAETGLDRSLASAAMVGANFKFHINSALLGFSAFTNQDVLRKTAILFNEEFPHTTIQCLGWIDGEILETQLPAAVPKFVANAAGSRAFGFFVTTEDGSHADNRIISRGPRDKPVMDYRLDRLQPAQTEHRRAIRAFEARLLGAGLFGTDRYLGMAGTAHALGSLVAGDDPRTSVVDGHGRVHGMANLHVADGSFLPRSSRVNPALSIYAWGLRLADILAAKL
jgi:choline dehydrogenase-like flavoprotein